MIFVFSYYLASWVCAVLRFAPANVIIRYIRSPEGLKWAFPVSLVLGPVYFGAFAVARTVAEAGHSWAHIFVLLFAISTCKFFGAIFISPFLLLAHWWRCRKVRRAQRLMSLGNARAHTLRGV